MKPDFIIEVSWDICNNQSEISKSIASKSRFMHDKNCLLIGPYFPNNNDFSSKPLPQGFFPAFDELRKLGIVCYFGSSYGCRAILIDFSKLMHQKNKIKGDLWEWFKVDSLHSTKDFEEKAVFGYAAGILVEKILPSYNYEKGVLQCYDWKSCSCLLYAKAKKLKIAKIYTSYSTVLGKALAELGIDNIEPDKEAYKLNIESKHQMEKEAVINSDLFTAISESVALEARNILGAKAAVILQQGLDFESYPRLDELSVKSNLSRSRLKEFVNYYFFPYYQFSLSETSFILIVSDSDGIEKTVKALSMLNKKLNKSKKTVIAFFFMPVFSKGIKSSVIDNKKQYLNLRSFIEENEDDFKNEIIESVIAKKSSTRQLLSLIAAARERPFHKDGNPPICINYLEYEANILNIFKKNSLFNRKQDNVKIVYSNDRQNDFLNFEEIVSGFDLGIFASAYEPIIFKPLETMALGIPVITTDRGFGRHQKNLGHTIIPFNKEFSGRLFSHINSLIGKSGNDRIKLKVEAKNKARAYDWKNLFENYAKSYELAIQKAPP